MKLSKNLKQFCKEKFNTKPIFTSFKTEVLIIPILLKQSCLNLQKNSES